MAGLIKRLIIGKALIAKLSKYIIKKSANGCADSQIDSI